MSNPPLVVVNAKDAPWEERPNEKIGRPLYRKDLFEEPETGMTVRLVRYPAGAINPRHTHPCGHGMYVLEGKLVTHEAVLLAGCALHLTLEFSLNLQLFGWTMLVTYLLFVDPREAVIWLQLVAGP